MPMRYVRPVPRVFHNEPRTMRLNPQRPHNNFNHHPNINHQNMHNNNGFNNRPGGVNNHGLNNRGNINNGSRDYMHNNPGSRGRK